MFVIPGTHVYVTQGTGSKWQQKRVQFRCDNESIVTMIRTCTSKTPNIMHLIGLLFLTTARYNFIVSAVHVPGKKISVTGSFPPGPNSVSVTDSHPTTATRPSDIEVLKQRALNLMANGIAASTRRTYTTAQRRFIAFCYQTKQLAPSGFPWPASERT